MNSTTWNCTCVTKFWHHIIIISWEMIYDGLNRWSLTVSSYLATNSGEFREQLHHRFQWHSDIAATSQELFAPRWLRCTTMWQSSEKRIMCAFWCSFCFYRQGSSPVTYIWHRDLSIEAVFPFLKYQMCQSKWHDHKDIFEFFFHHWCCMLNHLNWNLSQIITCHLKWVVT